MELTRFIEAIETALGKEAEKISWTFSPGMWPPYANNDDLYNAVGFKPETKPSNTAFKIY
ncbi:MAG: hypothetical protein R2860_01300 [Desulfobacterales bacterium]